MQISSLQYVIAVMVTDEKSCAPFILPSSGKPTVFYMRSRSQVGQATFQVSSSCVGLPAAKLDRL